jgi:hypothetical protein
MKTFEMYRNGTQQGTIEARTKKEAQNELFAQYGKDCFELYEVIPMSKLCKKVKDYSEMIQLVNENDLYITCCENEKDTEFNENYDTYQVSEFEDGDYFGEFVHNKKSDKINFVEYIKE